MLCLVKSSLDAAVQSDKRRGENVRRCAAPLAAIMIIIFRNNPGKLLTAPRELTTGLCLSELSNVNRSREQRTKLNERD